MTTISLARLRHILAVARTGSFSLAAEEEGISQPALSRSIQAFEARYDVRLFDRNRGNITLTPAGELAVNQARNMLAAAAQLDRGMSLYRKGGAGRIGIGLGPLLASVLLPTLGKRLLRASPLLQIVTRISPADQLHADLIDGQIEAVIGNRWHLNQLPGVERVYLGRIPLAMVVRHGHPAAGTRRLTQKDLAPFPVAGAIEPPARTPSLPTGAFVCDNYHILREIVMETDCLWLTSPTFVAAELRAGTLDLLDVADLEPDHAEIWLATLRNKTASPALTTLVDMARDILTATP
ncbi:MAG: LysR family transcriptional regulator [Novosphingobium sp.]